MGNVLVVKDLNKNINNGYYSMNILKGINMEVKRKEFVAIMGPSGSGKSTLLGILAGLDSVTSGSVLIDRKDICNLNDDELTEFRNSHIGIVFQAPNLIPVLSAKENIQLPMFFSDITEQEQKVRKLLEFVGMKDKGEMMPAQLSGGEQQRIAIARALICEPSILLADEPTGALDSENGEKIIEIFQHFRDEYSMTIVMVTHDRTIAAMADRIMHIKDGIFVEEGDNI